MLGSISWIKKQFWKVGWNLKPPLMYILKINGNVITKMWFYSPAFSSLEQSGPQWLALGKMLMSTCLQWGILLNVMIIYFFSYRSALEEYNRIEFIPLEFLSTSIKKIYRILELHKLFLQPKASVVRFGATNIQSSRLMSGFSNLKI